MEPSTPKKKTVLWVILYIVTGFIDIFQFILTFTGIGIGVSEFIEPFVAVGLLGTLQLSGVSIINKPKRLASILAVFGLDALTLGIAPFWIIDVFYIHYDYRQEQRQLQSVTPNISRNSLNQDGRRQALNRNGVRAPSNPQTNGRSNIVPLVSSGVRFPQKTAPSAPQDLEEAA